MTSVSTEQKERIIALVRQGVSREEIVAQTGVSPGTVSAIKANITMGRYGPFATETEVDELIDASEAAFGLERDLQIALRANIEQLDPDLRITDGGRERTTEAGRIDITAEDREGATVVIELKAGTAAPDALTQLLAYMGAVGREEQKPVRGILVANDFHPRIVFAAHAVPNIRLRRYAFRFTFHALT